MRNYPASEDATRPIGPTALPLVLNLTTVAVDTPRIEHARLVQPVPLEVIAEPAGLLAKVAGVELDAATGSARIVDLELAAAVRDGFAGETGLRPVGQMNAHPVGRRSRALAR